MKNNNETDDEPSESDLYNTITCDEFVELQGQMPTFNIFRALRLESLELRHSNMLAWLMDPRQEHGLGEQFLRHFLALVMDGPHQLMVAFEKLERVNVEREFPIENSGKNKRPIDILIQLSFSSELSFSSGQNLILGIENKIEALQGKDQLKDYADGIKKQATGRATPYLIYLTKNEERIADADKLSGIGFCYADYGHVLEALKKSLRMTTIPDEAGVFINHYIKLIEEDFMKNKQLRKAAEKLWEDPKYAKVLHYLMRAKPELPNSLRDFIEKDKRFTVYNGTGRYVYFWPENCGLKEGVKLNQVPVLFWIDFEPDGETGGYKSVKLAVGKYDNKGFSNCIDEKKWAEFKKNILETKKNSKTLKSNLLESVDADDYTLKGKAEALWLAAKGGIDDEMYAAFVRLYNKNDT